MNSEDSYQFDQPDTARPELFASINDPREVEDDHILDQNKNNEEIEKNEKKADRPGFFVRIRKYPSAFLFALGLQYFNNGFSTIITLAVLDVFKSYFNL